MDLSVSSALFFSARLLLNCSGVGEYFCWFSLRKQRSSLVCNYKSTTAGPRPYSANNFDVHFSTLHSIVRGKHVKWLLFFPFLSFCIFLCTVWMNISSSSFNLISESMEIDKKNLRLPHIIRLVHLCLFVCFFSIRMWMSLFNYIFERKVFSSIKSSMCPNKI